MNKTKIGLVASVFVLLAGVSGYCYWDNTENFTGNCRSLGSSGYYADFDSFNGEDKFEVNLEEGEKLHLDAHIEKGKARVSFAPSGAETGFVLSSIEDVVTDLTADKSGRYEVKIRAKHAKGKIEIKCDDQVKDKTIYVNN